MRRQIGACGTVACLLFPARCRRWRSRMRRPRTRPRRSSPTRSRSGSRPGKREENLQSVPFSVAAPTPQVLRTRGAESLEDVSVGDGRLGRLPERRVPARRIALHPDRRPVEPMHAVH